MAWPTDSEVTAAVVAILTKGTTGDSTIPSGLAELISRANASAQADLTRILVLKGYTTAQVDSWDDQFAYGMDQAKFWSLMNCGGLAEYPDKFAKAFDRREELTKAAAIIIGGTPTAPGVGASQIGGISSGQSCAYEEQAERDRHKHLFD